ncbi:extracellular solute-binding protein [Paenibacillus daejeonensis]|uniref:extracellular solute-binding protein n=1 Tax=Paenibacillus daejeonensis TaxID=135193 RepID=UPI00036B2326|nr:extracellular solute-binding protein [Paenibacillus daejeonensis]
MAKRKGYWVTLCIVFALLLSACSSGGTGNGTGGNTGGNAEPAPGTSTETAGQEQITVRMMRGENPSQVIKTDTPVLQEIARQTGVTINLEPVPGSNYLDKKRALLATNNIPDIMGVEASEVAEFAGTGMFVTISDYLDQMPNLQAAIEENPEINKLFIDGKLYSLPITEKFKIQGGKTLLMRMDILEEVGMEVPTTFDELYEVLAAMKQAYPDSYPWTTRGMSFMDAFSFGMGSGYGMTLDPDTDTYFYGTNKPEFKEVLSYLNRLYSERLLDPDFAVNTKQNWDEKLSTGRSFFYYDNNQFAVNYNTILQESNPEARFDRLPYLENAQGQTRGWLYPKGWLIDNYVISSKTKNPEALIKMFDWMYGEEGTTVTNYGVEGETYEVVNGQPEIKPEVLEQYANASDPARVMMSEIGGGLLALAVRVDEGPTRQMAPPDLVRWGEELVADPGAVIVPGLSPAFTDEENDRIKDYTTRISVLEQDVVKFIIGTKSLDDFDAWASELTAAGAEEMEQIYNEAYTRTP